MGLKQSCCHKDDTTIPRPDDDAYIKIIREIFKDGTAYEDPFNIYERVDKKPMASGAFGDVLRVRKKSEKSKEFAIKSIKLLGAAKGYPKILQREIALMLSLSHPEVIEFKQGFFWNDIVYIVMERFNG